jgi:predicted MFS family arabinose efflux permease
MLAADVGRAALTLTVPVAYALGALTFAQLCVVAFCVGTLAVVFNVAYSGLFVALVPRVRYVEGNSLVNGSRALSYVGGPSVGGLLVQALTAPFALVADALSFLGSAAALRRIAPVEPPTEEATSGHLAEGIRFVRRTPVVRAALGATATINFFNFVFFTLFVLYATRTLGVRPGTLGLVLGAGAVGGVLGSIVAGRVSRRVGIGPALVAGCVLFTAPFLLVPLAAGPRPLVLGCLFLAEFGSGLGVMILDISAGSLFAALVPDRLRSRVTGAYMLVNYGVRPLGSITAGVLGATLGLRPTLWIAALGGVAGAAWLLPSPVPRLRELPLPAE